MATYLQRLAARVAGRTPAVRSVAPGRALASLDDPFERTEVMPLTPAAPSPPAAVRDVQRPTSAVAPPLARARELPAPPIATLPAPPPASTTPAPPTAERSAVVEHRTIVEAGPVIASTPVRRPDVPPRAEPAAAAAADTDALWAALERLAIEPERERRASAVVGSGAIEPLANTPPRMIEPPRPPLVPPVAPPEPQLSIGRIHVEVVAPPPAAPAVAVVHARAPRPASSAPSLPHRRTFGLGQS